jgi:hypothetical protein
MNEKQAQRRYDELVEAGNNASSEAQAARLFAQADQLAREYGVGARHE